MEPKLKVFLSSAQFNDEFAVEREGLPTIFSKQPLYAGFVLWRIEDYASPEDIEMHYVIHVDDSDILILLLGKTYRNAVEKEFRRAIAKAIPVFAFLKDVHERDPEQQRFIEKVRRKATSTSYSGFRELVERVENSLFQYYLKGSKKPEVLQWRTEHDKRKSTSAEERSLRLLAGILASDAAGSTKDTIVEAVLMEAALSIASVTDPNAITTKALKILGSKAPSTRIEIDKGLQRMLKCGAFSLTINGKIEIEESARANILKKRSDVTSADNQLLTGLHKQHKDSLRSIEFETYRAILTRVITQVVYESAIDMAKQEFGCNSNPFSYDADELNRIVASALSTTAEIASGEIAVWQPVIVAVLQSNATEVITWLNRLRKAYWALAVLGMDPQAVEYAGEHVRGYCVYLDSHIVLRAIVDAGGESAMCREIVSLARTLGVEMRLSQPLFQETSQAFNAANRAFHAAGRNVLRALRFLEKIHRKSDIFDGYLMAKTKNPNLSWTNFINKFYSPSDESKLESYLSNEMGIVVQPERDFSTEQHGRIEDITQQLLMKRRKMVHPPENLSNERRTAWERQYLLRTNEARQMAIVYQLRHDRNTNSKQYWFVTFDEFVYEVSTALVSSGDSFFGFPCYMKPATWLDIIVNASSGSLPINTFREVLLSRNVQQIADQLEATVISQMLEFRVDQDVGSIETLRHMFADIVNRPAVQEAYQKVLEADGLEKLTAADKVKDQIISGMKEKVSELEQKLGAKTDEVEVERKKTRKAEGKAKYFKRQIGRLTIGKRKKKY